MGDVASCGQLVGWGVSLGWDPHLGMGEAAVETSGLGDYM